MDIKDYIKELSNLNSNKYSKNQTISLFIGIMFHLMSDKEIFKKNIDIKIFLKAVLNKEYKDYLFRSRPYLISRVLNDIIKEKKFVDILKTVDRIISYLEFNNELLDFEKKASGNTVEDNILDWFNQINNL